jgi:hypothetical protein
MLGSDRHLKKRLLKQEEETIHDVGSGWWRQQRGISRALEAKGGLTRRRHCLKLDAHSTWRFRVRAIEQSGGGRKKPGRQRDAGGSRYLIATDLGRKSGFERQQRCQRRVRKATNCRDESAVTHRADNDDAAATHAERRLLIIQAETVDIELRSQSSSPCARAVANARGCDVGQVKEGKSSRARGGAATDDDCSCDGRAHEAAQARKHARPVCVVAQNMHRRASAVDTAAGTTLLQGQRVDTADAGGGRRQNRAVLQDGLLQRHGHGAADHSSAAAAGVAPHGRDYRRGAVARHLVVHKHAAKTQRLTMRITAAAAGTRSHCASNNRK